MHVACSALSLTLSSVNLKDANAQNKTNAQLLFHRIYQSQAWGNFFETDSFWIFSRIDRLKFWASTHQSKTTHLSNIGIFSNLFPQRLVVYWTKTDPFYMAFRWICWNLIRNSIYPVLCKQKKSLLAYTLHRSWIRSHIVILANFQLNVAYYISPWRDTGRKQWDRSIWWVVMGTFQVAQEK